MKTEKQQFNVYLTPGTIKQMKHRAVDEQLSLSDLVENVFTAYLGQTAGSEGGEAHVPNKSVLTVQPMLHVDDMAKALDFYTKLGAIVLNTSRDGDWALLRFGTTELGLLARPANPEQEESKVELNFDCSAPLEDLEKGLRTAGVTIVRPTGDEGFGYQLQLADADGMLIKINQLDPELYR